MRPFSRAPIDVSVVATQDISFEELVPNLQEAGLQEPHAYEEAAVVYGVVANKKVMNALREVPGVLQVAKQRTMGPAAE